MFTQFAKILGGSDIKLEIAMNLTGGVMAVTIVPVNLKPGMETIRPIQVSGTPEELDAGFFGKVQETLVDIITTSDNLSDVKKDLKKVQTEKKLPATSSTSNIKDAEVVDDDDEGSDDPKDEIKAPAPAKEVKPKEVKPPRLTKEEQKALDYKAKVDALAPGLFVDTPVEVKPLVAEPVKTPDPVPATKPEPETNFVPASVVPQQNPDPLPAIKQANEQKLSAEVPGSVPPFVEGNKGNTPIIPAISTDDDW